MAEAHRRGGEQPGEGGSGEECDQLARADGLDAPARSPLREPGEGEQKDEVGGGEREGEQGGAEEGTRAQYGGGHEPARTAPYVEPERDERGRGGETAREGSGGDQDEPGHDRHDQPGPDGVERRGVRRTFGCGAPGVTPDRGRREEGEGGEGERGPPAGRVGENGAEERPYGAQDPESGGDRPHAPGGTGEVHRHGHQPRAARGLRGPAEQCQREPGRGRDDDGAGEGGDRAGDEGRPQAPVPDEGRGQGCSDRHGPGEGGDHPRRLRGGDRQ